MKKLLTLTTFLLALAFVGPGTSEAATLHFENYAEVTQYNYGESSSVFEQVNITVIHQRIRLDKYWLLEANSNLLFDFLNDVVLYQDNFCVLCVDVVQENILELYQNIISPELILVQGNLLPGLPPGIHLNEAYEDQENNLFASFDTLQVNFHEVYQVINFFDPISLTSIIDTDVNLFNYADIWQVNECFKCWGGSQVNYALILQDIRPIPEPGTILLLGSGLTGIVLWRMRKKAFGDQAPDQE